MPGGYYNNGHREDQLSRALELTFGSKDLVSKVVNNQVFLNRDMLQKKGLEIEVVQDKTVEILLTMDYIQEAFTARHVSRRSMTSDMGIKIQNGYNTKRSGDVMFVTLPHYLDGSYGRKGTSHQSGYNYDTHVPILFYGKGVKSGSSVRKVSITDIAPTLSTMLRISLPSSANGEPLKELFE